MARVKFKTWIQGHIKKDDVVRIIAGKDKGKQGRVLQVFPEEGRLTVERLNMIKRHTRPTQQMQQGGIIEREGKLHLSNVMIVCTRCGRGVRVGHRRLEESKDLPSLRRSAG